MTQKLSGRYKVISKRSGTGTLAVHIVDPVTGAIIGEILFRGNITEDERSKIAGDIGVLVEQSINPG